MTLIGRLNIQFLHNHIDDVRLLLLWARIAVIKLPTKLLLQLSLMFRCRQLSILLLCGLLLSGCKPMSSEPVITAGELSYQQAQQALADGARQRALSLYQQAAAQGHYQATLNALALMPDSLEAAHWLMQYRALHDLSPTSDMNAWPRLYAAAGLWRELSARQQQLLLSDLPLTWRRTSIDDTEPRVVNGALSKSPSEPSSSQTSDCRLPFQPVLSRFISATAWQRLVDAWQQDPQLNQLAICFQAPIWLDIRDLACQSLGAKEATSATHHHSARVSTHAIFNTRIQCQSEALLSLLAQQQIHQLLVLVGHGSASYNNGWLQLPEHADLPLLRHELAHSLDFIDEYPLAPMVAKAVCKPGQWFRNVLFSKQDLVAYRTQMALTAAQVTLTPVDTCRLHPDPSFRAAYRPVVAPTMMQRFEFALPDLYLHLMQLQLQRSEHIMPVHYYFAYQARQKNQWQLWYQHMQKAAAWQYAPAIAALEEFAREQPAAKAAFK